MPTLPVLGPDGSAKGSVELAEMFGAPVRVALVHQSVVREMADRRVGTHSTRGRSEVSGGGRKPWRQKGTGRARQGSIRATQWKGGGKPFGPRPRKYDKDLPAQMRRGALRSAWAAKFAAGEAVVVDALGVSDGKTKTLVGRLGALQAADRPTLLVVATSSPELRRAARNLSWLVVETAPHVSAYQVIRSERIVLERAAVQQLQEALA